MSLYLIYKDPVLQAHLFEQSVRVRHPTFLFGMPMHCIIALCFPPLQIVDWYVCCVLSQRRLQVCRSGVCVHQSRHSLCSLCLAMSDRSYLHEISSPPHQLSSCLSSFSLLVSPSPALFLPRSKSLPLSLCLPFVCLSSPTRTTAVFFGSRRRNGCVLLCLCRQHPISPHQAQEVFECGGVKDQLSCRYPGAVVCLANWQTRQVLCCFFSK
jgi:hypothetical protein